MSVSENKKYRDECVELFQNQGWLWYKDVVPDEIKPKKKPVVDLIVFNPKHGHIALIFIWVSTMSQGALFADAWKKIKDMKDYTYLDGTKVKRWCIAYGYSKPEYMFNKKIEPFVNSFLNAEGTSSFNGRIIDEGTPNAIMIKEE